jgi:hypothetical protein
MVQAVKPILTLHTDSITSQYFLDFEVLSVYTAESFWQLLFIRSIQMVYPVLPVPKCTVLYKW